MYYNLLLSITLLSTSLQNERVYDFSKESFIDKHRSSVNLFIKQENCLFEKKINSIFFVNKTPMSFSVSCIDKHRMKLTPSYDAELAQLLFIIKNSLYLELQISKNRNVVFSSKKIARIILSSKQSKLE